MVVYTVTITVRSAITIFFLLLATFIAAQPLNDVRSKFHSAVLNPDDTESFYNFMGKIENPSTTVQAYQAVSEALLAQVVWNPFKKLSQVMKYEKLMSALIEKDPKNVEIRFLRLAIEYNLPSFLGMSKHLEEDVDQIVMNLSSVSQIQINPMFGKYIFYFLKETDLCTQDELDRMKKSFEQGSSIAGAE